jgi:4-amino-4-deoxy-L-arabinose transferase-like glycosyltransferase
MAPRLPAFRWRPDLARRELWLLGLVALVVLAAGLGLRQPWPADEPRFALVGYDMARHGDWFFPRVAGELYPDKPPVFMWLIGLFYLVTGSLEVAFLLPSLLAGLGTLWLVWDLARRLWHPRIALAAAGLLLCTLQFALQARTAQIDALVTFFITLGLYGILRHALLGPAWGWFALGGFAAGIGVITKGVGFTALFVLLPWGYAAWRGWPRVQPASDARLVLAPLALLAAVALWLVPMLLAVEQANDPAYAAYRDNILHKQTAERYAAAWHHHNPAWYYLVEVIPFFWLPLALLLPWLVPAWWRRLRRRDARLLLPLGFALLTLLFFSASPGKRGVYILPLLPMVALAAAPLLPALLRRPGVNRLGWVVLAAFALLLCAFPFHPKYHALAAKEQLDAAGFFFALGGVGLAWLAWALLARARRGMLALGGFLASLWLVYGLVGHPLLDPVRSATRFTAELRAQVPPGFALGLVAWDEEVVLQAGRPVTHFGFRRFGKDDEVEDALRWLVAAPSRLVLLPAPKDEACIIRARAVDLGDRSRRRWLLAGPETLTDDCRNRLLAFGPPPKAVTWVPGPDRALP